MFRQHETIVFDDGPFAGSDYLSAREESVTATLERTPGRCSLWLQLIERLPADHAVKVESCMFAGSPTSSLRCIVALLHSYLRITRGLFSNHMPCLCAKSERQTKALEPVPLTVLHDLKALLAMPSLKCSAFSLKYIVSFILFYISGVRDVVLDVTQPEDKIEPAYLTSRSTLDCWIFFLLFRV